MACHKTLKAGDVLYVGDVRIRTTNKTSLSVEADKSQIIIHVTENRSGGHEHETTYLKE